MRTRTIALIAAAGMLLAGCGASTSGIKHSDVWRACEKEARSQTVKATTVKRITYNKPDDSAFSDASDSERQKVRMKGTITMRNHAGFEWDTSYTCTAFKGSGGGIIASTGTIMI